MRVLGLIPARGGSKGVPRKNLRVVAGRSLIDHTARAAFAATLLTTVVLSSEDEEILGAGRALDLVTLRRPPELASDATPTIAVVQHAVSTLASTGERFDAVCLLQPTNPSRPPGLIDQCIQALDDPTVDAALTVSPVPHEHNPHWVYFRDRNDNLRLSTGEAQPVPRRQDLPAAFHRSGCVYVTRTAVIMDGSLYGTSLRGIEVDPRLVVNIDTEADLERAEHVLSDLGEQ